VTNTYGEYIMTKFLTGKDLKAKGVNFSQPTLMKLEAAGKFPRRTYLSERKPVWLESEVDEHLLKLAASRG
jgi:predicted DNA-binding transcriptional regulator AlpA